MEVIQQPIPQNNTGPVAVQLSVVVPLYNQERNVITVLTGIRKVLESTALSYEIVAVDDGSLDKTLEVLRQIRYPNMQIISYSPNMGKGYAVKEGVLRSRGNVVMFIDGDLDIMPEVIGDYLVELDRCDLVIASKSHPKSRVVAPTSRKLLSKAFNFLVRITVGIKLRDTQSGLKAGNGDALRAIFKVMLVKRYAFDVELLKIATMLGLSIKEMPIEINLDRRFKVRDILRMFVDILGISYRARISHWYQRQIKSQVRGR